MAVITMNIKHWDVARKTIFGYKPYHVYLVIWAMGTLAVCNTQRQAWLWHANRALKGRTFSGNSVEQSTTRSKRRFTFYDGCLCLGFHHHVCKAYAAPLVDQPEDPSVISSANALTLASKATPSMLKNVIRIGPSKPDSIVAMFPGVGALASSLIGLASGWHTELPRTQFILFESDPFSGDRALSAVCHLIPTLFESASGHSNPAANGYDQNLKIFDSAQVRSNFFGDVLLLCCNDVSRALEVLLSEAGLTDKDLVLAGFSQGASVAAYTGFMRNVAGTILMGGPGAPQSQLFPPPAKTQTKVCIVSGDSDVFAPHEQLANAFRPYGNNVHIIPGLRHRITGDHVKLGSAFISSILAKGNGLTPV